jgi:hypothetical protein
MFCHLMSYRAAFTSVNHTFANGPFKKKTEKQNELAKGNF